MTTEINKERELNKALFYMMHIAFVEIRSAESLNASKKFADVFHNVPLMLSKSSSVEEDFNIYEKILEKSKRYDMEGYMESLKNKALKSVK